MKTARVKAAKPRSSRSGASKQSAGAGSNAKQVAGVWFDRVFRAQSIHFYRLLGFTLFLVIFGVVMVLSASSIDSLVSNNSSWSIFLKQAVFAVIGLSFMSVISLMSTRFIRSKAKLLLFGALGLQVLVIFIGKEVNGNRNWIDIGGFFAIQPSEFLKIAVILFVANYLAQQVDFLHDRAVWFRAGGISIAAIVLVMVGKDLGTVIIMTITFIGMLILAGMPQKLVNLVVVAGAFLFPLAIATSGSRLGRVMAWFNPTAPDPFGYNWQSEHGTWALAAGRIFGAGLGESKMKWSWIPEVENDFIFAVIGEELGLVGALVVITLFVMLAFSFLRILQRTQNDFSRIVVSAVMLWIVFQAMVNIAVVLRLLPVLGVPLPLISAGGSSLIANLSAIGVVLAIERENHANPFSDRRQGVRRR